MKKKFLFICLFTLICFSVSAQFKQLTLFNKISGVLENLTSNVIGCAIGHFDGGIRLDITLDGNAGQVYSNKFLMWVFGEPTNDSFGTRYNIVSVGYRDSRTGQSGFDILDGAVAYVMMTYNESAILVVSGNQTLMEIHFDGRVF